MPGMGTDCESDIARLRLAHRVELLTNAIDAIHRLHGRSRVLDRLLDLARQAIIAPYGMLAVPAAANPGTVDFRTSGQLPDQVAIATIERVSQVAEQLLQRKPAASRLIQVPVFDAPDPARWSFFCVPIHRRGVVIGLLGVTMVDSHSTFGADELRMLELLGQCASIALDTCRDSL